MRIYPQIYCVMGSVAIVRPPGLLGCEPFMNLQQKNREIAEDVHDCIIKMSTTSTSIVMHLTGNFMVKIQVFYFILGGLRLIGKVNENKCQNDSHLS